MGEDKKILCNGCGKPLKIENGILKEDCFEGAKEWGYFSQKDLEIHQFNLCEECYNTIVNGFVIPITVTDTNEV